MQSCKWFLSLLGSLLLIQQTCAAELTVHLLDERDLYLSSQIPVIIPTAGSQTTAAETSMINQIDAINDDQPVIPSNNTSCPAGSYVCAEAYEGELSPVQRVLRFYHEVGQIN